MYKIANYRHGAYKPKNHANRGYQQVIVMHLPKLIIYEHYLHSDASKQNSQFPAWRIQAQKNPKTQNSPPPPSNTQKNMTHTEKATDTMSNFNAASFGKYPRKQRNIVIVQHNIKNYTYFSYRHTQKSQGHKPQQGI